MGRSWSAAQWRSFHIRRIALARGISRADAERLMWLSSRSDEELSVLRHALAAELTGHERDVDHIVAAVGRTLTRERLAQLVASRT